MGIVHTREVSQMNVRPVTTIIILQGGSFLHEGRGERG